MAGQIEEGRVPHADLGDAVERAVQRWHERAAQASSSLIDGATAGGVVAAVADPDDLDQVLDVLIDNALIHGPGHVEVSASPIGARATVSVGGPRSGHPRG